LLLDIKYFLPVWNVGYTEHDGDIDYRIFCDYCFE